jgi:maltooligosyltrehalose trehalohydrolase
VHEPRPAGGEVAVEDFTLPGNGLGRVALLRPVNWDYFYDAPGRTLTTLTRKLLRLRRQRADLRQGAYWYYANSATYQTHGVMIFGRSHAADTIIIAVNFTDADATVPFIPPTPGQWIERLDGQTSFIAGPGQEMQLTIPSNYGHIWTLT